MADLICLVCLSCIFNFGTDGARVTPEERLRVLLSSTVRVRVHALFFLIKACFSSFSAGWMHRRCTLSGAYHGLLCTCVGCFVSVYSRRQPGFAALISRDIAGIDFQSASAGAKQPPKSGVVCRHSLLCPVVARPVSPRIRAASEGKTSVEVTSTVLSGWGRSHSLQLA